MSTVTLSVDGDRQAIRAMKGLDARVRREVLGPALRQAMGRVLELAKDDAPVDSGHLRQQIKLTVRTDRRGNVVVDVALEGVPYAGPEEYGTDATRHKQAEHFMLRAYDERGSQAAREATREILAALDRLLK